MLLRLFCAVIPNDVAVPLIGAPPPASGVATPDGLPFAPGATAHACPDADPLAAVSRTSTLDAEMRPTLELLAPPTWTIPADVLETLFWARSPVAETLPELAVVMPGGTGVPGSTVGARATEIPD